MKLLNIILFIFINSLNIYSQGFDWQYSARLPFEMPDKFAGLQMEYGISGRNSNFSLTENNIHCCIFEKFEGKYFKIGLTGENWIDNESSIIYGLNANLQTGKYNSNLKKLPILNSADLVTQSEINSKSNFIEIDGSYNRRLFNSNFFISGGINLLVLISDSKDVSEFIVSPDGEVFNKINKNRREIILNKSENTYLSNEFSSLVLGFNLGINYNIDLGLGKYLKIEFTTYRNINSYSSNAVNSGYNYGISIKYLHDLNSIFH